jgi:hypothetical protein
VQTVGLGDTRPLSPSTSGDNTQDGMAGDVDLDIEGELVGIARREVCEVFGVNLPYRSLARGLPSAGLLRGLLPPFLR